MPLHRLITLLAIVIALAAVTVGAVVVLAGGQTGPSMIILAGITIVTLTASIALRRFGKS